MKLLDWVWIALTVPIGACVQPARAPSPPAPPHSEHLPDNPKPEPEEPPRPVHSEHLHGTIVVKVEGISDYIPASGTMQVYLSPWSGDGRYVTVPIQDGRWRCPSPYNGRGLAIGRLLLDGRDAFSYTDEFVQADEREIDVEANWLEPTRVHVRDQHTHQPVAGARVRLFSYSGKRPDDPRDCSPQEELAKGDGEFSLDAWSMWMFPGANKDGYQVWVEAPGYQPRIQFLDPWRGGDWIVELSPDR